MIKFKLKILETKVQNIFDATQTENGQIISQTDKLTDRQTTWQLECNDCRISSCQLLPHNPDLLLHFYQFSGHLYFCTTLGRLIIDWTVLVWYWLWVVISLVKWIVIIIQRAEYKSSSRHSPLHIIWKIEAMTKLQWQIILEAAGGLSVSHKLNILKISQSGLRWNWSRRGWWWGYCREHSYWRWSTSRYITLPAPQQPRSTFLHLPFWRLHVVPWIQCVVIEQNPPW